MKGYLVNDALTQIPGTRTFWHFLLDWFPKLRDCTGLHYDDLAPAVEQLARHEGVPDYLIRNASYFRRMEIDCPQLAYLQDPTEIPMLRAMQRDVLQHAIPVFASPYIRDLYREDIVGPYEVIPIGTDFDLFYPYSEPDRHRARFKYGIPELSVCYVGTDLSVKGFDLVCELIEQMPDVTFVCVMKLGRPPSRPNVRYFAPMPQEQLRDIYNACAVGICTSPVEAQHISGQEMGACDLPLVTTPVAVYHAFRNQLDLDWGAVTERRHFAETLRWVLSGEQTFRPREAWYSLGFDLEGCRRQWESLINRAVNFQ